MMQPQTIEHIPPSSEPLDASPLGLVDLEASAPNEPAPALAYGTVLDAGELLVELRGVPSPRRARRAKSCLVACERGDRVLCSVGDREVHVLAVLDGAPETRIVTDGKLEVRAGEELELSSPSLRIRARAAVAAIEELKVIGRAVDAHLTEKATFFAERVESGASRWLLRAKQAFRFVEELDQTRAGNLDLRAESFASVRGENTIVAARVLAKLDGEQVKIG